MFSKLPISRIKRQLTLLNDSAAGRDFRRALDGYNMTVRKLMKDPRTHAMIDETLTDMNWTVVRDPNDP